MNKTLIKMYYRMGIYSDTDLDTFVNAGYITSEEMKEIIDVQGIKDFGVGVDPGEAAIV